MTTYQLYEWIGYNQPMPYEVRRLSAQLSREITEDEAWYLVRLYEVACAGPGTGKGYKYFDRVVRKMKLFPFSDST